MLHEVYTPTMDKQTVFKSEENKIYRIPALIYLNNGDQSKTLLAFAEQRSTTDDASGEKLVMKKGEVNSSVKTVMWSDLKVVEKAHIDGYRPMNPCPVYDKNKDKDKSKLFLFFICVKNGITEQCQKKCYCNKTRLCYITSTDCGTTWSDVNDLTEELCGIQNWATFAVGPGHGIQTEGGRLIIPVYAYSSCCRNCHLCCCCCPRFCVSCLVWCRHSCCCNSGCCNSGCCESGCCDPDSYALSLYKDPDHSWTFGKMFETKSNECQMAEISKDEIYCNARSTNGFRVETFSHDKSDNFGQDKSAQKLVEVHTPSVLGCQGSVISFPAKNASNQSSDKWLLFTHPTGPGRMKLGVYLNKSPSEPKKWSKPWVINKERSGYSDLAYIDDCWFACLFECGEHEIHEQIAFVTFTEDGIKENIPV